MKKYFCDPNSKTTFLGAAMAVTFYLSSEPALFQFLEEDDVETITGVLKILSGVFAVLFAYYTKSKDVTGGSVPSTYEAENRISFIPIKYKVGRNGKITNQK